jgi:outer membrane protein assembly factor BamB
VQFDPTGQQIVYTRRNAPGDTHSDQPEATVIHEMSTGREHDLLPPYLSSPRFSHDGRYVAGERGDGTIGYCSVDGTSCQTVGRGASPVLWASDDSRLYCLRGSTTGRGQEVWSLSLDGKDERKERELGSPRAIDRFFDLSVGGEIVSAPVTAGRRELWTARLR